MRSRNSIIRFIGIDQTCTGVLFFIGNTHVVTPGAVFPGSLSSDPVSSLSWKLVSSELDSRDSDTVRFWSLEFVGHTVLCAGLSTVCS